ncbi:glycoside hydrolase family 73 protein [Facklamia sp. P12945]|uniref:glycoside hydrolase family 73 protein n=1 Tax=unclassified Facklamia TaxID=2622293 RepID=UPI003D17C4A6
MKNNKKLKQFKKWQEAFFKRLGCLSFFMIIFISLLFVLLFRWMSQPAPNFYQNELYQSDHLLKEQFIADLVPTAQALQREFGVYASVSLAQAVLESDFGRSQLASQHNNLYGVKTSADDPNSALYPTMEFFDGEWVEIKDYFKVYPSRQASMREHALLMINGTSWDPNQYQAVLQAKDFQSQAQALQDSGYATDPNYGEKLINMIEEWQLDQYDQP